MMTGNDDGKIPIILTPDFSLFALLSYSDCQKIKIPLHKTDLYRQTVYLSYHLWFDRSVHMAG